MSNQIVITSGAKVRNLNGVLTGTAGVVDSVPLGGANGVATLDSSGKVPVSQLPASVVTYLGTWNAATNTPTLTNGVGDAGDMYLCNVAGTVDFGAGPISFNIGDWVLYGSGTWQKSNGQNGTVTSVDMTVPTGLAISGNPITTSGTLALSLASGYTIPTTSFLSGLVPYTGATGNVDLGTYGIKADYSQFNLTPSSVPTTVGTLSWDSEYRTLQLIDGDGDTTLQIGQEQRALIHNGTGSTLTDGQVVYVTGSTGQLPSVALASNTLESTSSVTFGVVTETIPHGSDGFVTISGMVNGLNTLAFNEGDALYLGATAGTFTNVKPTAPANLVLVGYVIKKSGGNGSIFVKIINGYELSELHDVSITSVSNNEGIFWDSATSLWKNKSIPTALGYTPLGGDGVAGRIPYYTGTTTLGNEAAFNYDANTNRLGVNTNTPNATIGANAGTDSGYSLLLKNADTNYNGIGFGTDSTYGNLIATEKIGTALTRNLTLFNQGGYVSLTEAGNFGIGMINPNTGLDIYNGTNAYLWLHTATSGVSGTDGVRLALFNTNTANLRNFEGAFSITAEGNFSVITLGAENLRVESSTGKVGIGNPASVPEMLTVNGSIQQSSVTSALLKTDLNGKLIPAVAGSDYLTPSAISGALNTVVKFTSPTQIGNSNITDDGSTITLGSKTFVANGNLGVGTSNPAVSGVGIDIYSATNTGLRFHNAASGTTVSDGAGINFSSGLNLGITNYEAGTIDIVTNGNSGVFIASNGYVGINGAVGGYPLDVSGSIKQTTVTSSMLKADASGVLVAAVAGTDYQAPLSNIVTGFSAANNVALWSGTTTLTGTSNLWYNSTSNFLGIGTNNPQRRLTIFNATLDSQVQISGGAPSVALTDAVTGAIYQAKFAMATAAGHYVSGAVAGDFVLLSQTGATIFATSSTEKMRINTSGRLLLGTTTDNGSLLQVAGSATFSSSVTANGVTTINTGAIGAGLSLDVNNTGTYGLIGVRRGTQTNASAGISYYTTTSFKWFSGIFENTDDFGFYSTGTGGFPLVIKHSSGNVGIGTSSPGGKLVVVGASSNTYISIDNVGSGENYYAANSVHIWQTAGSERMRITSGGNVGIGTSSPVSNINQTSLTINGTSISRLDLASAGTVGATLYYDASNANLSTTTGTGITFATNGGSERMRITSSGDVLFGTTTYAGIGISIRNPSTYNTGQLACVSGDNAEDMFYFYSNTTTLAGIIGVNGNTTSYYSVSDYRAKQDLKDFSGLDVISKFKMYDFEWILDGTRNFGGIAHEIQEVLPYAVTGEKDGERNQAVDYAKLVPINTKAIQELYLLVQEQQTQIEELKQLINNK